MAEQNQQKSLADDFAALRLIIEAHESDVHGNPSRLQEPAREALRRIEEQLQAVQEERSLAGVRIRELQEQYENLVALRDDLTLKAYERGQENERLKEQYEALHKSAAQALAALEDDGILWISAAAILRAALHNSNPASSPLCECGHTVENHHGDPMTVAHAPCRATVYTDAPLGGGNAFTCHCRDYVPASEPKP